MTGSSLDIYSLPSQIDGKKSARPKSGGKKGSHVQHVVKVWSEDRHTVKEGRNRAHLAHLEGLKKTNPVWISAACFDASVRVFDLEQQRTVTTLRRGDNIRYWQTQEYAEHLILSGADDGYLRLWDLRMPSHKANVAKSRRHIGRVSAFIINPLTQTIMTASCHSNPNHPSSTGANLRLFDLRSMSKDVSSTNMDELSAKLDNVKI